MAPAESERFQADAAAVEEEEEVANGILHPVSLPAVLPTFSLILVNTAAQH